MRYGQPVANRFTEWAVPQSIKIHDTEERMYRSQTILLSK